MTRRLLARMAITIRAALAAYPHRPRVLELPCTTSQKCQELARQIQRARGRGWELAAADLEVDLRYSLAQVRAELSVLDERLAAPTGVRPVASASEIYEDLVALEEEFATWSIDPRGKILAVTTSPIELEGIALGQFEVRLNWERIGDPGDLPYRCVALDPRPAAARDDVTHPHVRGQELCEGEGRAPIRRALAEGRVLDFFHLVSNLLQSYNPDSPYVTLVDWFARPCADCGLLVDDEDEFACTECESRLCDECRRSCGTCGDSFCNDCLGPCEGCDDQFCSSCLPRCAECRARRCRNCLDDQERCERCHDQADPAISTDGLGQTPVSA
jgi:hypothetical protein